MTHWALIKSLQDRIIRKGNSGCAGNSRQRDKWGSVHGGGIVVQLLQLKWQLPTVHSNALIKWNYMHFVVCTHRPRTDHSAGQHRRRGDGAAVNKHFTSTPQHVVQSSTTLLTSDCDPFCFSSPSASFSWPGWPLLSEGGTFIHGHDRRQGPGAGREDREREYTHIVRI